MGLSCLNIKRACIRIFLLDHKGDDRYVFRDKSGEINVIIPAAVFDGREVQPDQMININGSLDKKAKEPLVRVNRLQK